MQAERTSNSVDIVDFCGCSQLSEKFGRAAVTKSTLFTDCFFLQRQIQSQKYPSIDSKYAKCIILYELE
jgi:hypothetical protein